MYKRDYIHTPILLSNDKCLQNLTELEYDTRLSYTNGRWYIHLPLSKEKRRNEVPRKEIALDPGKVIFQTGWSPQGEVVVYGQDNYRLIALQNKLSALQSARDKSASAKTRRTCKKHMQRLRLKQQHLIKELHCKTVYDLTQNYNRILLPSFESQDMVKRQGGRGRKFNRGLLELRHYQFQQRLLLKAEEVGVEVHIVGEAYTSRTCTRCGTQNICNREYRCSECDLRMHRDVMGARNIYLRHYYGQTDQ